MQFWRSVKLRSHSLTELTAENCAITDGTFCPMGGGTIEARRRVPPPNLTLWATLWSVKCPKSSIGHTFETSRQVTSNDLSLSRVLIRGTTKCSRWTDTTINVPYQLALVPTLGLYVSAAEATVVWYKIIIEATLAYGKLKSASHLLCG